MTHCIFKIGDQVKISSFGYQGIPPYTCGIIREILFKQAGIDNTPVYKIQFGLFQIGSPVKEVPEYALLPVNSVSSQSSPVKRFSKLV